MGSLYQRWNIHHRLQHILLFVSFFLLTFTGLPLKYAAKSWAIHVANFFGGVEMMMHIHKVAAVLMIIAAIYHLGYLVVCRYVKKERSSAMLPNWKDVTDVLDHMAFCLGMTQQDARFDRYSYKEKFDYWAVFWGIAIMVGSGLILWFPHISAQYVSRTFIDCAQIAHSDEAMLAVMAVFIWHFYNVHFSPLVFPMNKVWLNGKMSYEEMQVFHPLELKSAEAEAEYDESIYRRHPVFIAAQMIIYGIILIWFLWDFLPLGLM